MWIDHRGSEVLTMAECLRLVAIEAAGGGVGRLGVPGDDAPIVVPVNFSLSDHQVLVRMGEGSLWHRAKGQLIAFEIDHIDLESSMSWSVLIRGLATQLSDPAVALQRPPHPLVPDPGSFILTIRPDVVTGRRFSIS